RPCHHTGVPTSNIRSYLWSRNNGPFGKELTVSEAPTPDGTSGYSHLTGSRQRDMVRWTNVGGPIRIGGWPIYSSSEVPISRINTEGVVQRIRRIADSPIPQLFQKLKLTTNPALPLLSLFPTDSKVKLFPVLPELSIPTSLPPSHARPSLNQAVRTSPNQQPRNSPITTSQQPQPMASSSRRRD
ncbi:hypothetical protein O181_086660, partial [Austropuccinia psidii MF-1]|nr:hypothetical protein [Austropuccinia psidii MF-1]